jgi:hypothetical protein
MPIYQTAATQVTKCILRIFRDPKHPKNEEKRNIVSPKKFLEYILGCRIDL